MIKKRIMLLIVLSILVTVFFSCQKFEGGKMEDTHSFVKEIIIDNSNPLDRVLTVEYELQDLQSFFGEINLNENIGYKISNTSKMQTIDSVNDKFPIECLRFGSGYYTIYKVKKGGFFYVFWCINAEHTSDNKNTLISDELNNLVVYFTAYLSSSSFCQESDFCAIRDNISTAEDISTIDPAFELTFLMSNKIASYSMLNDGLIMEITYWNNECSSRKDLIVKSKEVVSKEKAICSLSHVLSTDLP